MEQNTKRIGLVNLVVLLVIGVAASVLARYTNTFTGLTGMIYLGLGLLVIAIGYFQMRMEEAERLERLEFEEINKTAASASLFNTTDSEVFPAQRSREQFERFFVPGFTVFLFILQALGTYYLWTWLAKSTPLVLKQPTVGMSLFGLFALSLFLLGKYSVGLARLEGARLLRPGANYLLLGAYVCFVITASIAAVQLGFIKVDLIAAKVLAGVLGLIAIETIINLLLEIYRPRVKGKVGRVLYDSRLVGLLAEPEGLFTTAAHALDYQFGFKVSETWFYRFLQRALVWLILLQVGVLLFSTCFVFISPGEQGLLERLGRPVGDQNVLDPGLHVKLPWPIDKIYRYQTRKIQSIKIGAEAGEDEAEKLAVLWSVKHAKDEANWLVASTPATNNPTGERGIPTDLLNVSIPVQFQISDLRLWAYKHADASNLLEKLASRELVRYLAGTDLLTVMTTGRSAGAEWLRKQIEARAKEQELGVDIVYVGLEDLHPPVKVAPEFEKVVATLQSNEAQRQEAKGFALQTINEAKGEAVRRVNQVRTDSDRWVSITRARAGQFTNQLTAFRASPSVYMERSYLQTFTRATTNAQKYINTITNDQDLYQFDLQSKIRSDLLDKMSVPPINK
jgi:regulator of protease activity HflC (stomatin/prohibitin superfamily)